MKTPLRERLRWRNASRNGVEAPATRAMMTHTAALFFGGGRRPRGSACSASFVPGEAQFDDGVLLVAAAVSALPRRGLLLVAWDSIPPTAFHPVVAIGTAVATAAASGWGTESAYGPLPLRLGNACSRSSSSAAARRWSTSR